MMYRIHIVVDWNDGDYITGDYNIDKETFLLVKKVASALKPAAGKDKDRWNWIRSEQCSYDPPEIYTKVYCQPRRSISLTNCYRITKKESILWLL